MHKRLSLYKELDNIKTDEGLDGFREKLIDRFGPVPRSTQQLIITIRLRRLAKQIGFERLLLKNNRMTGYFVSNPESDYYQSEIFGKILKFVQQNSASYRMRENKDKLTLSFPEIQNIDQAIEALQKIDVGS